ncbi:MAG: hypothetical protein FJX77_09105, partial [Armatimonadetes bacterium]|nr:hypothetical protein [Armatimonadota bacterium]
MIVARGGKQELARDLLALWERFTSEVRIVIPTRYWVDAGRYPQDAVVGESSVCACAWSIGILTVLGIPWRPEPAHRLEPNPEWGAERYERTARLRRTVLEDGHVICLGGPPVNSISQHFVEHFTVTDPAWPLRSRQVERKQAGGETYQEFVTEYLGREYEPEYAAGHEGDPDWLQADYGFVVWRRIEGGRAPRWLLLCLGARTAGMQAAMAALTTRESAAAIYRIVGEEDFHLVVRVEGLLNVGEEHPVSVLTGSHPEFAIGSETIPNPEGPALHDLPRPGRTRSVLSARSRGNPEFVAGTLAPTPGPFPWSRHGVEVICVDDQIIAMRGQRAGERFTTHPMLCNLVQAEQEAVLGLRSWEDEPFR